MDARSLLDQFLASARQASATGADWAADKAGVGDDPAKKDAFLKGVGGGAAAAGALAILLGTRSGRKVGGSALKLGALAAVAGLAYKAYRDHQAGGAPELADNARANVMILAMAAAAKADGEVDPQEALSLNVSDDPEAAEILKYALAMDADPAAVAALSTSPELAREIYAASVMVIGAPSSSERVYLDALAQALDLEPGLAATIESQAPAA